MSEPAGQAPDVLCRHCGTVLIQTLLGDWTNARGFQACIKSPPEPPPGPGKNPDPRVYGNLVLHQPMPAGLRGAPQ